MEDCAAAFAALTVENGKGFTPFKWQMRLLRCFMQGDLPSAVDVPTGLGKTAVMALWLIARAADADVPRKLVYVVDRRAVVDQASRFAVLLRENMPPALAKDLQLEDSRLPISTLRGGFADNRKWLEDPSKPAIVVGTIDMVGSRLLFEGYGVSRRMRPYHAGLLGADTLFVLDEAHLCSPFEALLRQIEECRDSMFGPAAGHAQRARFVPRFRLLSLSATGRDVASAGHPTDHRVFRLENEDQEETAVHQRLTASKRLALCVHPAEGNLPEILAARALHLGNCESPRRILVYCDKRKDAVAVKTKIDKEIKDLEKQSGVLGESELLVGERRICEREALEEWLETHGFFVTATPPDVPTFLIATSAGEVGVDLDADHIVCDLVAFERMVQRFGRVNRRGRDGHRAIIDVVCVPPKPLKANAKAPAKAKHEQETATFRARKDVLNLLPCGADGRRDASPSAVSSLRLTEGEKVECASTPAPLFPALTRPLVEAWALTSLKEHEGRAAVAPWLRGWEDEEEPQVHVVWRKHLPRLRQGEEFNAPRTLVADFFECAPIHATEKLEALRSHVTDWLKKRAQRLRKAAKDDERAVKNNEIIALVVDRAGDLVDSATLSDVLAMYQPKAKLKGGTRHRLDQWERSLAGATLVVDSRMAGIAAGMLDEKADAVPLTADGQESRLDTDGATDDDHAGFQAVKFGIMKLVAGADEEGLAAAKDIEGWQFLRSFETDFDSAGNIQGGLAVFKAKGDQSNDNDEGKSILSRPQALRDHAEQVAAAARTMAERLGLPNVELDALERAARLHDDGKAARIWQEAMNAPAENRPYAKTRGGGDWRRLGGYRHEFGSLLLAQQQALPGESRDLILHLISAHHGYSRPLIPTAGCEDAAPSVLDAVAGEAALRFARLQKQYGIWGLAWLEAILRAADASASRAWDQRGK